MLPSRSFSVSYSHGILLNLYTPCSNCYAILIICRHICTPLNFMRLFHFKHLNFLWLYLSLPIAIYDFMSLIILSYIFKHFSHGDSWKLILHVFCNHIFILSSFSSELIYSLFGSFLFAGRFSISFTRYHRYHCHGNTFTFSSQLGVDK